MDAQPKIDMIAYYHSDKKCPDCRHYTVEIAPPHGLLKRPVSLGPNLSNKVSLDVHLGGSRFVLEGGVRGER